MTQVIKLTVVDDEDNVIGEATKSEIIKNKWNYRCSQIFLFNKKKEFLISKRPHFKKRYPNKWTASAGGKVDAGETYEGAAHRELKEELGVEADLTRFGKYTHVNNMGIKSFAELYIGKHEGPFKLAPNEVDEVKWVSMVWIEKDIKDNDNIYSTPFLGALGLYSGGK